MNTEEREISLIDLIIYVAKGWRAVLVWIVIMAIAVGGLQYVREIRNEKAYLAEQPGTDKEQKEQAAQTLGQLRREMDEEEIKAVSKVLSLEKDYAEQQAYMQKSLLMAMDAYNVSIARLRYWVVTNYEINYMGITKRDFTSDVVDSYVDQLGDVKWRKKAMKAVDADMELPYFNELIGVSNAGDTFVVSIRYTDEEELQKIVDVLKKEVENHQDNAKKIFGKHELTLVSESIGAFVDNDVYANQQNRKNNLINLENSIAGYKAAFNDDQKSLYAGEILVNDDEDEETKDGQPEEEEDVAPPTPQVRVKYILLGAILGAFLVCMARAMVYILSGKLKAEDNIDVYLGVPGLGWIEDEKKEASGTFGKLDAWIDGFSRRNSRNLSKEQQIQMAVSNIALYCEKGDMKNIYFNSSVNCCEEKAGRLKELLKKKGVSVKDGFSILQDARAMEDMSKADGVVFLEQAEKSRYEDLEREIKLCREHGKAVIGLLVLL